MNNERRFSATPVLLLAGLLVPAAGCRPEVEGVDDGPKQSATERAVALEEAASLVETASASISLAVQTPDEVLPTSEHGAAFARPDRVYLESYGPLGEVLSVTRVAEGRLAVYFPADQVWLEGAATPENTAKILGAPVEIGELARALLAEPLVPAVDWPGTIRYLGDLGDGLTRLAYRRADGIKALLVTIEPGLDAPREQRRFDADGAADLVIGYDEYTEIEGVPRPGRVVFDDLAGSRLEAVFLEQSLNPELPADIFELSAPPDAHFVDLDAYQPSPAEN
ncbi:MAG: hypothetical protein GF403_06715 [Candidatus Coatesbacteria bacterium]|nr:hypothetical protein [Candidatus Coatesbacteria bacterium]